MSTTLQYLNQTVVLRDPDFGNVDRLEQSRINRQTRGGDLEIFRDPNWPTDEIQDYKFSFLTQVQINQLLAFFDFSLGQIITLIDHENFTWSGVIITPNGEVSQPARQGFSAQFQFQGSVISGP